MTPRVFRSRSCAPARNGREAGFAARLRRQGPPHGREALQLHRGRYAPGEGGFRHADPAPERDRPDRDRGRAFRGRGRASRQRLASRAGRRHHRRDGGCGAASAVAGPLRRRGAVALCGCARDAHRPGDRGAEAHRGGRECAGARRYRGPRCRYARQARQIPRRRRRHHPLRRHAPCGGARRRAHPRAASRRRPASRRRALLGDAEDAGALCRGFAFRRLEDTRGDHGRSAAPRRAGRCLVSQDLGRALGRHADRHGRTARGRHAGAGACHRRSGLVESAAFGIVRRDAASSRRSCGLRGTGRGGRQPSGRGATLAGARRLRRAQDGGDERAAPAPRAQAARRRGHAARLLRRGFLASRRECARRRRFPRAAFAIAAACSRGEPGRATRHGSARRLPRRRPSCFSSSTPWRPPG